MRRPWLLQSQFPSITSHRTLILKCELRVIWVKWIECGYRQQMRRKQDWIQGGHASSGETGKWDQVRVGGAGTIGCFLIGVVSPPWTHYHSSQRVLFLTGFHI